ncbi:MAG TPA: lytic transglycosylase domain-containing protein [Burkholderiaceae bacterium]|nr:lytic transglycosylase domain-containing protein [Burkholderiaceae bacterium]
MSSATISFHQSPVRQFAWTDAVRDVRDGALATVRLVVTFSGCSALLLAAVLLLSEGARSTLVSAFRVPSMLLVTAPAVEPAEAAVTPAGTATETPVAAVDPRQKHVVQYLSRRYRVAEEATRMLVAAAFQIGKDSKLDPLLILSVVAIESSLNPFAESAMGAQGLMQVMTRVHAERFEPHGGHLAALDPIANMKVGSAILNDLIIRGGSIERGLQLYVGAGNLPDDGGYGARVLGERARLALAATGKVDAAIAAGRTATAASETKPASTVESSAPTIQPVSSPPAGTLQSEETVRERAV